MNHVRIIYGRADGGVTIVTPCRNIDEADLAEDFILQRALNLLPPDAINPQVITPAEVPGDRNFREAWEHGGSQVSVNMDKARNIHMDRIRVARDAKLAALDVDTMKAVGKGDNVARDAVESQKQALRDIPQTLDLTVAKTPEELKAIWPSELQ